MVLVLQSWPSRRQRLLAEYISTLRWDIERGQGYEPNIRSYTKYIKHVINLGTCFVDGVQNRRQYQQRQTNWNWKDNSVQKIIEYLSWLFVYHPNEQTTGYIVISHPMPHWNFWNVWFPCISPPIQHLPKIFFFKNLLDFCVFLEHMCVYCCLGNFFGFGILPFFWVLSFLAHASDDPKQQRRTRPSSRDALGQSFVLSFRVHQSRQVIELLPRRLVEETEVTAIEAALGVSGSA